MELFGCRLLIKFEERLEIVEYVTMNANASPMVTHTVVKLLMYLHVNFVSK